jgi:NAD(P)H-hydrate epimerase
MITGDSLSKSLLLRGPYAHKGDFGHALIIAGSKGKMGAAVLSARACMRSGVGLLTVHVPDCGYSVIQVALPEAMASVDDHTNIFSSLPDSLFIYRTVGIGPGIGTADVTSEAYFELINKYKQPMVLDADALNIMAKKGVDKLEIPEYSILTPHPGEFERLFGSSSSHFERMQLALKKSFELKCVIVLKSKNTLIACPDGSAWICPTGNAGMAKAGSGDVLTGILTGLLARGYDSEVAAKLGVYMHGYAGDLAAVEFGQEAMQAGDLINMLPHAFKAIAK